MRSRCLQDWRKAAWHRSMCAAACSFAPATSRRPAGRSARAWPPTRRARRARSCSPPTMRPAPSPRARWSTRPRRAADTKGETRQIVLVADDAALAAWAAMSELDGHAPLLLEGGMPAGRPAALPLQATPALPADADCIDYLFFVHDRHDGNKEAARRYLAWETGLVAQLDAQERAAFRLPSAASHA